MDTYALLGIGVLNCLVLILLFFYLRKLLADKENTMSPVMRALYELQATLTQVDRSARDDYSRSRQEQVIHSQGLRIEVVSSMAGMGDSLSSKVDSLTLSTDQKLELLRSGVERRIDSFAVEAGRKGDALTEAVGLSLARLRDETGNSSKSLGDTLISTLTAISHMQQNELNEIRSIVDTRLGTIQVENEKKLEQMRQTVDEKLQGTLEARLGESFKQVSERLEQVYMGLGEMKTLATGVGDLKRVLTNVKVRGTWGETQLGAIIEEMLTPDQFSKNVATAGTGERVDYAVKLPGRDSNDEPVWLPIDAKFPVEDYSRLIEASERGDIDSIDKASRQLEAALKFSAKSISDKYLKPPSTTDFGILFLPTEGLYAEAMRRTGLAELIQREYRVVLSGPSTLAAMLSAFQMGFRTLAIQKRSSEVWEILGAVKTEFGKYSGLLAKVKKKLTEAQNTIDRAEVRSRVIQRTLQSVEGSQLVALPVEADAAEADVEQSAEPVLGSEEHEFAYAVPSA